MSQPKSNPVDAVCKFLYINYVSLSKSQIKYNEKGKLIFSTSLSSGATRD